MKTKLSWSVTVEATEKVEDMRAWSEEVERGLIASEMMPVDSMMTELRRYFDGTPAATFRWTTENEMEYAPNYKVS